MCGIAGIVSLDGRPVKHLDKKLEVMSKLLIHRGPDAHGQWISSDFTTGMIHRRLSIIDLSEKANQPMKSKELVISYNGEIYNYLELQEQLKSDWLFSSNSDTEVILAAYQKYDVDALQKLRGMFAFSIWDKRKKALFCARDRFGIKPFYYLIRGDVFYYASEAKALLPFVEAIETDHSALSEYLVLQYNIGDKTLFKNIRQLLPGHAMSITQGKVNVFRYWDIHFSIDFDHSPTYFNRTLQELMHDTTQLHLRSDVDVGAYLSGGVDSSLVLGLAGETTKRRIKAFNGRFTDYPGYDESEFASIAAEQHKADLNLLDINAEDLEANLSDVIYHLDYPVAGPGAFAQYMISKLAAKHVKVILGGQGGDEIFGGYARYTIAYLEQCLKAAIDGTYKNGNYVVTIESIIPNLGMLKEYKPLIKNFWSQGLFEPMDSRYFRLIDRSLDMKNVVQWEMFDKGKVFSDFCSIFNSSANVNKGAYFDKMTHYDFKCFLPALLQVEDRMSMAHGLESRVPFLDHPLVEFAATIPADIKFRDGKMKHMLKSTFSDLIPPEIINRRDKMGFPVPLKPWFQKEVNGFYESIISSMRDNKREYLNCDNMDSLDALGTFSRKTWGLVSLELWHQVFHDNADKYQRMACFS